MDRLFYHFGILEILEIMYTIPQKNDETDTYRGPFAKYLMKLDWTKSLPASPDVLCLSKIVLLLESILNTIPSILKLHLICLCTKYVCMYHACLPPWTYHFLMQVVVVCVWLFVY